MDRAQTEEYIKCRKDCVYFLTTYGKIRHPIKGILPFNLWDFQREVVHNFLDHSYNVVLKARQLGLSTLCAGYISWMITFFSDKEVYVVATKSKTATNLISKVKTFIENLPNWMNAEILVDNRQSIELKNGSKAQASSTTEDAARSEALSLLVIDEAAFIKNMEEIWISAQPTLATGGDCIALSTPNGMGNWFHKTYIQAKEGLRTNTEQSFFPMKLPWQLHPDRTKEWSVREKQKIGDRAFAQEHDCSFLQSGNNVILYKDLVYYKDIGAISEPIEKSAIDHGLWIWKHPMPGKKYLLSADVARGDGSDFSAFQVIDFDLYEQVAEYRGKMTTDMYAQLIVTAATMYNNCIAIVENTGIGHSVAMKVLDLGYDNCYWTIKDPTRIHQENSNEFALNPWNVPRNAVPGFTMSSRSRPNVVDRLEEDLRTHEFILHSERTFEEALTFIFENGRPEAQEGYNDDLLMSLGIGMYVRYMNVKIYGNDEEMTKTMLNQSSHRNEIYKQGIYQGDIRSKNEKNFFMVVGKGKEDLRDWL